MFKLHIFLLIFVLFANNAISESLYDDLKTQLAEPLSSNEIQRYNMTIFPDGTNLPIGSGSAEQGETLYNAQCMSCHGEKGIEGPAARLAGNDGWFSLSDPLRILRIEKHPILLISVGSLWPHASSIFDYIRRAMPHYAPKSLNNDACYALTAYILYLNDIIDEKSILDKTSIMAVEMPAKSRNTFSWPENPLNK